MKMHCEECGAIWDQTALEGRPIEGSKFNRGFACPKGHWYQIAVVDGEVHSIEAERRKLTAEMTALQRTGKAPKRVKELSERSLYLVEKQKKAMSRLNPLVPPLFIVGPVQQEKVAP